MQTLNVTWPRKGSSKTSRMPAHCHGPLICVFDCTYEYNAYLSIAPSPSLSHPLYSPSTSHKHHIILRENKSIRRVQVVRFDLNNKRKNLVAIWLGNFGIIPTHSHSWLSCKIQIRNWKSYPSVCYTSLFLTP